MRRLVVGVCAAGLLVGLAGCNASALTKVELVVYFNPNAPISDHAAALKACGHVSPQAIPEPIVKSNLVSDNVGDVRFRIDHANDKELAELTECLNKQPGVVGVDTPDLTD
ncbi:MAG TPA: hypothetical protein VHV79_08275 [Mycobacteriales bacterium]|jgi:hypothetical protein|nr:hypothetical protein [Mycobacteriales bacterium]